MFRTKLVSFNVMTTPKPPQTDNVPINLIATITTHSQQPKQHVFKRKGN
jgi:hypothetical protein